MKTKHLLVLFAFIANINLSAQTSGTCGSNLTWTFQDSVLTVSGSGAMTNWTKLNNVPWYAHCSSIKEVVLPEGLTNIGQCAFAYCNMKDILIPNTVTRIENDAFYNCDRLDSVFIPESVTNIRDYAFCGCDSLHYIDIGKNVRSISGYAFDDCHNLTSVSLRSLSFCAWSSVNYYFGDQVTEYILGAGIADVGNAFQNCSNISTITINSDSLINKTYSSSNNFGTIFGSQVSKYILGDDVKGIGSHAFYNCSALSTIHISHNVTNIGNFAFYGCDSLSTVILNSNYLTSKTYSSSSNLGTFFGNQVRDFIIGDSVTNIGKNAFYNCTGLRSITMSDSVKSVGLQAISGCSGLVINISDLGAWCRIEFEDWITSTYHLHLNNEEVFHLRIPSSISKIKPYAFSHCIGLDSIMFHNGIKEIGQSAFKYCKSLEFVDIPDSVTSIGISAFSGCTALTSINIPDGVTSIGSSAFSGCTALTSIGSSAFNGCTALTSINIPDGVTNIRSYAFYGCTALTSINIPESVTSIGDQAFYNCRRLTSITIPKNVQNLSSNAFIHCDSITTVTLNSNSVVSKTYTTTANFGTIFGPQVTKYIIGDSIISIGNNAFYNCTNITSVTLNSDSLVGKAYSSEYNFGTIFGRQVSEIILGEGVTHIGTAAFAKCKNLTSISIPTSLVRFSYGSFDSNNDVAINISDLSLWCGIDFNPGYSSNNFRLYLNGTEINQLVIPDSVTEIKPYTFYRCISIDTITVHNGITRIGDYAFYKCSSLTSVTISEGITSIGNAAFFNCSNLLSIDIPNSVTSIEGSVFTSCYRLSSVTIPNSVISIGPSAFSGCGNLSSINLPEGLTSINSGTFQGCGGLTNIIIPNSVDSIGGYAFYGCSGLTSISIPASIKSIGKSLGSNTAQERFTFEGCSNLSKVEISNLANWCKIDFEDASSNPLYFARHLYVEEEEIRRLNIPSEIASIGNYAFARCDSLTFVSIPSNITNIGGYAFYGCTSIDTIIWNAKHCSDFSSVNAAPLGETNNNQVSTFIFGDSVEYIPANLCANIHNLSSIIIPENVNQIGSNAFLGCAGLDSVIWNARNCTDFTSSPFNDSRNYISNLFIGDSVQHIPANLCNGMNRIKEITIPDNVETIGSSVFVGCDSLTRVDITNLSTWCSTDFTATSTPLRTAELYINGAKPQRIVVPNGLTKVGSFSLINCSQLIEVLLSPSVMEIGESAFAGGSRLQTVTLDANLTTIGDSAFNNCPYLITVNANMEFPPLISSSVFANCGDLSYVDCNVPQNSLGLYRKTAVWSSFSLHGTSTFTVSFVDWDNTPIASQTVLQGTDATAPDTPTRDGYTFTGWSASFTNVQADLTIIAQYEQDTPSDFELIGEGDSLSNSIHKVFENGQLYIVLPDGIRYDVTGRRIK